MYAHVSSFVDRGTENYLLTLVTEASHSGAEALDRQLMATGHLPCVSPRSLPRLVGVQICGTPAWVGGEVLDCGPSPLSLGTFLDHSPQPPPPSVASDPPSPWDLSTCHRPGPLLAT